MAKYCSNCGAEVKGKFCENCGQPLGEENSIDMQNQPKAPTHIYQPQKKKKHGCLISVVCFFIICGIIGANTSQNRNDDKQASNVQTDTKKNETNKEDNKEEEKEDKPIKFGKEGNVGDLTMIVNKVTDVAEITVGNGTMSYKPDSGKYAIINVTLKNTTKDSVSFLLNYFNLIGPDEAKYVATIILGADDKYLTIDTVNPNLDITGNLVFEIPKDLDPTDCILQYSDFNLFSEMFKFALK